MPDPVTLGGLAALALSMTAESMLKGTVGEAAKEAYHALKNKIAQWAGGDVAPWNRRRLLRVVRQS
jgi:hypothetical protein